MQFTERLLAGAIGAASARLVLTSVLRGSGMELGEVVAVLDEASTGTALQPRDPVDHAGEHHRTASAWSMPDMRLVAWNRRYQQMFGYPDGMLYVGRPVADLIR